MTCFGVDGFAKCSGGKRVVRPLTVIVDEVTCRRCVQLMIRAYGMGGYSITPKGRQALFEVPVRVTAKEAGSWR